MPQKTCTKNQCEGKSTCMDFPSFLFFIILVWQKPSGDCDLSSESYYENDNILLGFIASLAAFRVRTFGSSICYYAV